MELLAPSITTTPHAGAAPGIRTGSVRLPFIDNLRWVMIILVVAMHAAVTYSTPGLWYYSEPSRLNQAEQLFFYSFEFFGKTFRMGILFLFAGYFVPGAFERKGTRRFLQDRTYRLGLPTLLFMLVLGPVTGWLGAWHRSAGTPLHSFLHEYKRYITGGHFLIGFGPLWFCLVLLAGCFAYAGWRESGLSPATSSTPRPFPKTPALLCFIATIAAATFLARTRWPIGSAWFNLQFGYFPQYIAFFLAGILVWRNKWLTGLAPATGKRWGLIAVIIGPLCWLTLIATGNPANAATVFTGGWHWQSLAISLLEAFTGIGITLGFIALFREKFNRQGPRAAFLSANYFAVYVFHPPVLVAVSRAMAGWQGPALLKFAVATVAGVTLTYILAATLFRRIPLLKKIL